MRNSPEYQAALASVQEMKAELNKMKREDRAAVKLIRKSAWLAHQQIHPDLAEALALLQDKNLEWSSDINDIKQPLATLLAKANYYPSLQPLVLELATKLVFGEDD
jgi:membrane-bound lytic murein transglycosylase MltF